MRLIKAAEIQMYPIEKCARDAKANTFGARS